MCKDSSPSPNVHQLTQRQKCKNGVIAELVRLRRDLGLPLDLPMPQLPPGQDALGWKMHAGSSIVVPGFHIKELVTGPYHDRFKELGRLFCTVCCMILAH